MAFMTFFAFPLNLILAVLWITAIFLSYRHADGSRFVRFMLSPAATIVSIALFALACLALGITGNREMVKSWPFIVIMLFLMTVLAFVLFRGWKSGGRPRWRFIFNHAGLLLALSSAFWGAPDSEELRLQAFRDVPTREAYRMDGTKAWLQYEIELQNLDVRLSEDGTPSYFAADISVAGEKVTLAVNDPYAVSLAEDIYLSGYDSTEGYWCILQIVREPWKYPALAGIVMMLAGAMLLFIQGPRKTKKTC